MYYWVILAILFGYWLNSDQYRQHIKVLEGQYNRIKKLREMKKTMNIQFNFKMFMTICWLLWTTMWMMISQRLNNNVEQIGKNKYVVKFVIGGKRYSTVIKHNPGPSPVLQVVDNDDNDITYIVEPYILFNSHEITPGELGYENMSLMTNDGSDINIDKNDKIKIE